MLLGVDQQLGERPRARIEPVVADPRGTFVIRRHERVQEFSADPRIEGVEAIAEGTFEVLEVHGFGDSSVCG